MMAPGSVAVCVVSALLVSGNGLSDSDDAAYQRVADWPKLPSKVTLGQVTGSPWTADGAVYVADAWANRVQKFVQVPQ